MATAGEKPPQQVPHPASTAEDDLWKRSTDCVYFLASPLTCKKGSQCEYRHSEVARSNPRDCYYWFSGTCNNQAACTFRHPPLDVMVPPQGGSYAGPSPLMPPPGAPFASIPQNAAKLGVPCVYFQRGFCSRADKCNFLHGPVPLPNTKIQTGAATTASAEMPSFKKTFGASEKGPQPKMNVYSNASKSIETPRQPQANAALQVVKPRLMEESTAAKRYPSAGVIEEAPKFKETVPLLAAIGSLRSRAARPHRSGSVDDEYYQNGKDVDDSLRESSPGFDVLVDDKLEEDEYYHNDDHYVRLRGQEGRRSSEFDIESRDDYISANDANHHDIYHSKHGYHAYDGLVDKYPREQRQASSERPTIHDRRGPYKPESTDFIPNSSDLRHRLSKQRRDNGLRSVISPDYKADYHREDRGYQSSRRDTRRSPMRESTRESSFGSRLQGRIKLPRRSPPAGVGNMYSGRGNDRGWNSGRLSPSRPQQSSLQGRLRDRLSGRIQEESNEGRNFRGQMRKDSTFEDSINGFAPPKRLSELRGNMHSGNSQVTTGKLRDSVLASSHTHDGDISFDGPKPLSEILKRKRNATPASTRALNCDNEEGKTGKPAALSSAPEQTQGDVEENHEAQTAEADQEVGEILTKKVKLIENEASLLDDDKHQEVVEEGLFGGDEQGPEIDEEFDREEGEDPQVDEELEYDYEQDDEVEGYTLNEGEVADNEGFMDEDDGDDFAKKLGVSF